MHPYLNQKPLIKLCSEWDVLLTAYGPLGRPGLSQDAVNDPVVLEDPILKQMATKYERTVAQILLRYLVTLYSFSGLTHVYLHVPSHVITLQLKPTFYSKTLFIFVLFSFSFK